MKKFILLFVALIFLNSCTRTSPEVIVPTIPSYAGGWNGNMISNNQIVGKISFNINKDLIVTGSKNDVDGGYGGFYELKGTISENGSLILKDISTLGGDFIFTGQANGKVKGSRIVGTWSRPCCNLSGTFEATKFSY